jgi:hypothetical protein
VDYGIEGIPGWVVAFADAALITGLAVGFVVLCVMVLGVAWAVFAHEYTAHNAWQMQLRARLSRLRGIWHSREVGGQRGSGRGAPTVYGRVRWRGDRDLGDPRPPRSGDADDV